MEMLPTISVIYLSGLGNFNQSYSLQEALHCCRTLSFYLASFEYLLFDSLWLCYFALSYLQEALYCFRTLRSHLASCSIIKLLWLCYK